MWWCVGPRLCNPFRESAERGTQTPEWGKNSVSSPRLPPSFSPLPPLCQPSSTTPYHTALGYAATKPSINSADVSWQVIFTNHETYGTRRRDRNRGHGDSSTPSTPIHPPSLLTHPYSVATCRKKSSRARNSRPFSATRIFRGDRPRALCRYNASRW